MGTPNVIIVAALAAGSLRPYCARIQINEYGYSTSAPAGKWRHAYHPIFPKGVHFVSGDVADAGPLDAVVQEALQSWSTGGHSIWRAC